MNPHSISASRPMPMASPRLPGIWPGLMNVITPQVIDEIEQVIDHVRSSAIKGCVITSGKDTFLRGAIFPCSRPRRPNI